MYDFVCGILVYLYALQKNRCVDNQFTQRLGLIMTC